MPLDPERERERVTVRCSNDGIGICIHAAKKKEALACFVAAAAIAGCHDRKEKKR